MLKHSDGTYKEKNTFKAWIKNVIHLTAWKEIFIFSQSYSSKLLESSYIVSIFQSNISDLHITDIWTVPMQHKIILGKVEVLVQ
jgi:hypothetical protein